MHLLRSSLLRCAASSSASSAASYSSSPPPPTTHGRGAVVSWTPASCLFLDGWLGRHGWWGSCPRLAGKHRLHPIPLQHCAVHSIKSPPLLDRACLLPRPPTLASLTDGLGLHLLGTLKRPGWSERLVLSVLLALPTDREHAREPAATDTMHRWRCGLTSSAPLVPPRARSLSRKYVGPRLVVVLEGQDGLRPRVLVSVRRSRRAGHAGVTARTPGRCSTGAGGGDGDRWGRDPTVEEGIGIRQPGHGWWAWIAWMAWMDGMEMEPSLRPPPAGLPSCNPRSAAVRRPPQRRLAWEAPTRSGCVACACLGQFWHQPAAAE